MRASIPAYGCLVALLYCCWVVYRARNSYSPMNSEDKAEVTITVTGPDGKIIKPIARAPGQR